MTIRTPTKHTYYYFVIKNLKGLKIRKKKVHVKLVKFLSMVYRLHQCKKKVTTNSQKKELRK